jgi:hypothetical protein
MITWFELLLLYPNGKGKNLFISNASETLFREYSEFLMLRQHQTCSSG